MPFSTRKHKRCCELRGFHFGVSVKQMSTSAIIKGGQTELEEWVERMERKEREKAEHSKTKWL